MKSDAELRARDATRDLGAELLASVRQMKRGEGRAVLPDVVQVRQASGLSQAGFAKAFGVGVRTVQEWEQGRRRPSGPAQVLLRIVAARPDVVRDVLQG